MKPQFLLLILLLTFTSCVSLLNQSHNISMEEKGYNCSNSTVFIKNVTKQDLYFSVNDTPQIIQPGKKYSNIVPKGNANICYTLTERDKYPINAYCEEVYLRPCVEYNFTPTLF
jgi:hypothetical protein